MSYKNPINIAIQGCSHGDLDRIYQEVASLEEKNNSKIDLLLCCGDFQAVRNYADLACMAVPEKYKKIGDFQKYYFEEKKVPVKTIFVGGNHEASNYLWELPYGGWVAPNIFYMGFANRIIYKGLRIGGLSGIYKSYSYNWNHFERPPFTQQTIRSFYHSRHMDKYRLELLPSRTTDIFISHDWPTNVYNYGDVDCLLRLKPFFRNEISKNMLGDPNKYDLLKKIAPKYWYSAHLHCDFQAKIPVLNDLGCETFTEFFSLDKCRPKKSPLRLLSIDIDESQLSAYPDDCFYYDINWLAIIKKTQLLFPFTSERYQPNVPLEDFKSSCIPSVEDIAEIESLLEGETKVPTNFRRNIMYDRDEDVANPIKMQDVYPLVNLQTVEFCNKLEIDNPCNLTPFKKDFVNNSNTVTSDHTFESNACNPDEIDLS